MKKYKGTPHQTRWASERCPGVPLTRPAGPLNGAQGGTPHQTRWASERCPGVPLTRPAGPLNGAQGYPSPDPLGL
ncbi:unnamed protein product [Boreogadus saida]